MTNTNTAARRAELRCKVAELATIYRENSREVIKTSSYTYSDLQWNDTLDCLMFVRNGERICVVCALPDGKGYDLHNYDNPHHRVYFGRLPKVLQDLIRNQLSILDDIRAREAEIEALDAEESDELPPPPATISICGAEVATELPTTEEDRAITSDDVAELCAEVDAIFDDYERQAKAKGLPPVMEDDEDDEEAQPLRPRARVLRIAGYNVGDLDYHRFEVTAEVRFWFEGEDEWGGNSVAVPVVVTAPDYPYQSHNLEDDSNHHALRERLHSLDCRWGGASLVEIGEAIRDALKYEELPELEARRYCHGVVHTLEVFSYLEYLRGDEFEEIRDAIFAEDQEAAISALSEDLQKIYRDGREYVSDSCFDGDYSRFRDHLSEAIDCYFLSVDVATRSGCDDPRDDVCVNAVVTCGGPYCAIEVFFGGTPEVFYQSGSVTARVELSSGAQSVFDAFIEPLLY